MSALKSVISVVFEILVKKLRVEDTEAYQEMNRMNTRHSKKFLWLLFRFEPVFWQNLLTEKLSFARTNGKNFHQLSC